MLSLFGVEALLGTEHAGRAQHWYFHVQLLAPWLSLPHETNQCPPPECSKVSTTRINSH